MKDILVANVGKLFHATWDEVVNSPTYGQLTNVDLVNELTDVNGVCDYLVDNVESAAILLSAMA